MYIRLSIFYVKMSMFSAMRAFCVQSAVLVSQIKDALRGQPIRPGGVCGPRKGVSSSFCHHDLKALNKSYIYMS